MRAFIYLFHTYYQGPNTTTFYFKATLFSLQARLILAATELLLNQNEP